MRVEAERVVEELSRKLKEEFESRIDLVILFGSYARDEMNEESDMDVLVVGDVTLSEVIDVTYPLSLKYGIYISPIVMSREHFEMLRAEETGFIKNVLSEGVTVYARV
ncbi:nucleotidyltransferase domain-containing protein [Geoglobus acetivorans]|uniref:Polymerase nucleotidyl transferase domain-containing protein n=1 Tax=Geoglobus acetivorans TaxID=565033 RepID=A0A0A7GEP4_GEOAI|nr:hypothetical protein GACE_0335 [Geoglobus acetivorans]